jgi:hypothetical protein
VLFDRVFLEEVLWVGGLRLVGSIFNKSGVARGGKNKQTSTGANGVYLRFKVCASVPAKMPRTTSYRSQRHMMILLPVVLQRVRRVVMETCRITVLVGRSVTPRRVVARLGSGIHRPPAHIGDFYIGSAALLCLGMACLLLNLLTSLYRELAEPHHPQGPTEQPFRAFMWKRSLL